MATKYLDNTGLAYFWGKIKSWVTSRGYITSSGSITGNAATATRLAGPKHSYTTAANAAKNWYRIANANTSQTDTTKPIHAQFLLTAYNTSYDANYYEEWYIICTVFGRAVHFTLFGNHNVPFSQARILYENTTADVDSSDRPAIDIYLNNQLANGTTKIEVEEVYNSGWTFVADGQLAVSTIPTGFENVATSPRNVGINDCTYADYASRAVLNRSNITANITLADNNTYRAIVLNCTNAITVTVPSINSAYSWFLIKNFNAASTNKNVTIHPSTTSVLIDDSNADIVLKPGEWVIIASKAANSYTLISDGRWKSQKADKGTTLNDYGITDAKIANGTITLGSSSITPLTSHQALPTLSKTDSGSGNAVTAISVSNHAITVTKGSTFLTSHQSLSDLGIGNVKNYDQSKAIKSITRRGRTFTYTCLDDTTGTFTQQDSNTTYTFATGDSDGQIKVTPSGGSAQNVSVKGLKSAAYTESSAYAAASHGTHVTFPSSGTPANIGTATNGTASTVARSDHVHALPDSGVTAGTYNQVTVDAKGRVTAGNVKHSYTTAANAAKNWYRIANASTQQLDTSKPIHAQFILTAYNTSYAADYYERWFVNAIVFGRTANIVIFGGSTVPFSQARILYENTVANIDASDRPALDIYLNNVLPNGTTKIEVEEVYNNGGWTFLADGQLAASTVPSGFENVACSGRNNGVERSTYADYVSCLNRQISSITAAFTLADSYLYRSRTLNCTGTFTITVPSINSGYMWCVIKNKNATSGVITLHPSTTSVLIDNSNADITLQPGEYVCIHSAGANNYSLIADGRWMSLKADKDKAVYNTGDQNISGLITLESTREGYYGNSYVSGLYIRNSEVSRGVLPSAGNRYTQIVFGDAEGELEDQEQDTYGRLGVLEHHVESNGVNVLKISCYKYANEWASDSEKFGADASLAVGYDENGNIFSRAVSTSENRSDGGDIVTRNWIPKDTRIVHSSGNETITGAKTFNSLTITTSGNFIKTSSDSYLLLCGGGAANVSSGGAFAQFYGRSSATLAGGFQITVGTSAADKAVLQGEAGGTLSWGGQPIQTSSDERLKTPLTEVPDGVLDAWGAVGWGQFQYLNAVERKGDAARLHLGLIAQRVRAVFEERGLDACAYGILCHEVRPAVEDEPAVDLWTVRYAEALAMEAAFQRRRADRLEARIAALEEKLNV